MAESIKLLIHFNTVISNEFQDALEDAGANVRYLIKVAFIFRDNICIFCCDVSIKLAFSKQIRYKLPQIVGYFYISKLVVCFVRTLRCVNGVAKL